MADNDADPRLQKAPIFMLAGFSILAAIIGFSLRKNASTSDSLVTLGTVLIAAGVLGVLAAAVIGVVRASR